ncbi:MAG: glycosyltransferase family 2 protein [bacterium]|nr:glycosyltransferase family 2 protein [bacterium]
MAISPELNVIMPVYNEAEGVTRVVTDWVKELSSLNIDFRINIYNDGSKDRTSEKLEFLGQTNKRIKVYHKKNSGHGPTILLGYNENKGSEWIFQVDSDGEMPPECFKELWRERDQFDFIIGRRDGRKSNIFRSIMSFCSRMVVRVCYGRGVWDVNSPYRLMRTDSFRDIFTNIPNDTFAPNLIISGMAGYRKMRVLEKNVPHRNRIYGQISIRSWKLIKVSLQSLVQTIKYRTSLRSGTSND